MTNLFYSLRCVRCTENDQMQLFVMSSHIANKQSTKHIYQTNFWCGNFAHSFLFNIFILIFFFGIAYLLSNSTPESNVEKIHTIEWLEADQHFMNALPTENSSWTKIETNSFNLYKSSGWIKIILDAKRSELVLNEKFGLRFSGFFASELYLNNEFIAQNGVTANSNENEIPGKIDYIFKLPSEKILKKNNEILIKISNQKLQFKPAVSIHYLELAASSEGSKRSSIRYLPVLFTLGVFITLIAMEFKNIANVKNNSMRNYYLIAVFAIIMHLLCEMLRANYNYPYNFHIWRFYGMFLMNGIFGLAIINILYSIIWPKAKYMALSVGVVLTSIALYLPETLDGKVLSIHTYLLCIAIFAALRTLPLNSNFSIHFLGACLIFPITYCFLPFDYMDQGIFLASAVFLFLFEWIEKPKSENKTDENKKQKLAIKSNGREYYLSVDQILYCNAAGNYTEIADRTNKTHFSNYSLGRLEKFLPENFVRIHKSHIVNIKNVQEICIEQGSKYSVRLIDGIQVPLSRTKVKDIRKLMYG